MTFLNSFPNALCLQWGLSTGLVGTVRSLEIACLPNLQSGSLKSLFYFLIFLCGVTGDIATSYHFVGDIPREGPMGGWGHKVSEVSGQVPEVFLSQKVGLSTQRGGLMWAQYSFYPKTQGR